MVREQIEKKGYLHLLGGGVVLTGGGSLLAGAAELASEIFGLPARIGYPVRLGGLVEEYHEPDVRHGGGPGAVRRLARGSGEPFEMGAGERRFTSVVGADADVVQGLLLEGAPTGQRIESRQDA